MTSMSSRKLQGWEKIMKREKLSNRKTEKKNLHITDPFHKPKPRWWFQRWPRWPGAVLQSSRRTWSQSSCLNAEWRAAQARIPKHSWILENITTNNRTQIFTRKSKFLAYVIMMFRRREESSTRQDGSVASQQAEVVHERCENSLHGPEHGAQAQVE